ncbi:Multidrug resistance-associated protein 7 [Chionoecetes opilio]|uniref:Multidrug resistance-associated protein 7 n=1 Tax=Chionoecetes opilio TaxID=41210 RepID=A0A8J4YRU9_CHIOP|nr:Multidrug resistance-associated protein 7 [Chionoecetes opilio]
MEYKDRRVGLMAEVVAMIRMVKLNAWEATFKRRINDERFGEVKALAGRKYLDAACVYFWATTPVLIPIAAFTTYTLTGNNLDAASVFTAVALFNLLIMPLNAFPWVINGLVEARVSLRRVQRLMQLPDIQLPEYYTTVAEMDNTDSDIQIGQVVAVVGRVGAGKTSLLSAVMGEMSRGGGAVAVAGLHNGFGVATQRPWVQNTSIKDNILFGNSLDVARYRLHLLLSRHPRSSTSLVHTIQRVLHLTNEGWEIAFQWVPSHAGIPGNEVADSAARMALTDVNTTPFPLPLSAAKRLIPRVCRSTWNNTLGDALRITSMGQYHSDFPPALDTEKCPHFHSHRVVLQSQLLALNVTTCDLPTLLAAAGVPPSRQHAVIRLTCAFLRRTGQLPRLSVVSACALDEDLANLPQRDNTLCGHNGAALSGGQRARVALARAVYQNKQIYLLDDIISSVDPPVARHIIRHCVHGLLAGRTVLLASSTLPLLSRVDWVVRMAGGRVVEQEAEGREEGEMSLGVLTTYLTAVGIPLVCLILLSLTLMQASRNLTDLWLAYWVSHVTQPNTTGLELFLQQPPAPWLSPGTAPHPPSPAAGGETAPSPAGPPLDPLASAFNTLLTLPAGLPLCLRRSDGCQETLHKKLLPQVVLYVRIGLWPKNSFHDNNPLGRILNRFSSDLYSVDDSLPFQLNILLAQLFGLAGAIIVTIYGMP